jgi:hypothetical protein
VDVLALSQYLRNGVPLRRARCVAQTTAIASLGLIAGLIPATGVSARAVGTPSLVPAVPRSVWLHELDASALPSVQSRLDEVLDHVFEPNRTLMSDVEVRVHVVPDERRITDLPPWTHLRGVRVPDGLHDLNAPTRTYDDVRGLGPAACTHGPLDLAIGEEQMVASGGHLYGSPGRGDFGRDLVHELGHVVECGLTEDQRAELARSYAAARRRPLVKVMGVYPAYSISNQREYFAEGAAAWFEAGSNQTYRRSWLLEHDPALYGLLASVFAVPAPVPTCDGERATSVLRTGGTYAGTPGPDVVVGSDGNDLIHGGGGADIVCAGTGDDVVFGGFGDDRLLGGPGNDLLNGGVGNDKLVDGDGVDRLVAGGGNDTLDATDTSVGPPDLLDGSDSVAVCTSDADDQRVTCQAAQGTPA